MSPSVVLFKIYLAMIYYEQEKVFYKSDGRKPYHKTSNVTQQRVDEILDKINQKGYHFLTDEEKNILKRAAGEDL